MKKAKGSRSSAGNHGRGGNGAAALPPVLPDAAVSDPAASLLERCRDLVEDLSFSAVADWKARHPGSLAIGTLPVYVPRPLLEAQGCLPVALFGGGDQIEIIRGDSYFQSYICQLPRSVVELGLRGKLEALDGCVFPSTCDVIRNLSGVWRMLFLDRYVSYLDLPQTFDPEVGGRFYRQELERISGELTERGARPLDDDALARAIVVENRRRQALEDLDQIRRREPWRLLASEAYLAARAGAVLPAAEHFELLDQLTSAILERRPRAYDNVRVVVVGAFCEQPPLSLIRALETAGCYLVDDDFQLGLRVIEGEIVIAEGEEPLAALARAFLEQGAPTATRYIGSGEKGAGLVEQVRRAEADGVVFAAPSFCDPALLDRPMLEAALDRAGIPHTSFKYAENTGQFQVIREQAGAFSDAVKLWGGAA